MHCEACEKNLKREIGKLNSVREINLSYKNENAEIFFNPEIIFHASAYKHVTPMDAFPMEAVKTNIIGTWNIINNLGGRNPLLLGATF